MISNTLPDAMMPFPCLHRTSCDMTACINTPQLVLVYPFVVGASLQIILNDREIAQVPETVFTYNITKLKGSTQYEIVVIAGNSAENSTGEKLHIVTDGESIFKTKPIVYLLTSLMYSTHILCSCTLLMFPSSPTPLMYSTHVHCSYTLLMHTTHACTLLMHTTRTPLPYYSGICSAIVR